MTTTNTADLTRRIRDVADLIDEAAFNAKRLVDLASTSPAEHHQRGARNAYKHAARLVRNLALETSEERMTKTKAGELLRMMGLTTACGCKVDHSDRQRIVLEYCPLHAAATPMLDALKGALTHLERIAKVAGEFRLRLPGDGCTLAHYSEFHRDTVRDAIAKAEKGTR